MTPSAPLVLFGAFDRHNFGDVLFPHVVGAMLPRRALAPAGLADRDLTRFGGHRVARLAPGAAHLVHVGGELLTCTAWQAAVMLCDPAEAAQAIARYDGDPTAAARWAAARLGTTRAMPYVAGRECVAPGGKLVFNAVGGVEWTLLVKAERDAVTAALHEADWLSVRDRVTQAALRAAGIDAALCPDPAVMVIECFGETIRRRAEAGAVQALRDAFPRGYLACQFSADFGDDATLDAFARELGDVAAASGLGIALFCAGTAPWHDDPAVYAALERRLPNGVARVFDSLDVWDICALIAVSRGFVGSSLHGRIVALACALPRVSLAPPQQGARPDKRAAFAQTWEPASMPAGVVPGELAAAVMRAFAESAHTMQDTAADLRTRYRASHAEWAAMLPPLSGSGVRGLGQ